MLLHQMARRHLDHGLHDMRETEGFHRTWNFVGDKLTLTPLARISDGDRLKEPSRVGMFGIADNTFSRTNFDDLTQIHHGDTMGDTLNHGHIMGNEEIGYSKITLKFHEEVHHLRPDGHVKR